MDRPPQRRRLPFPVKKYVWPFLSASIAMFSLLLTHQLIWRAFFDLSWRLSPPDFWLTATALEPRPKPLSPSFSPYRILTTNNSNLTLELLSPPDRQLTVSVNGSPIHVSTRATGNSTLDVALRRGSNNIEAKLSPDLANPYSFHGPDYVSLRVVYHAAQVTPPWILGGQSRKLRGYETPGAYIYGFGEPESDVSLSTGPNTQTDRVGFFSSFQFSRENKKSLGVTVRTTLPTTALPNLAAMSLDLTKDAFQYLDPKQTVARNLQIKVDEHQFQLKAVATLPSALDLRQDSGNAAQLLRDVFGICLQSDLSHPDLELTSFACDQDSSNPAKRLFFSEIKGNTYTISISRPLASSTIRVAYLPSTALAYSFLTLPDDSIVLDASPSSLVQSVAEGYKKVGTVLTWDSTSNLQSDPLAQPLSPGDVVSIAREVSPSPATAPQENDVESHAPSPVPTAVTLVQRVRSIEQMLPQTIRAPIQTILSAIPFLWFVWILGRYCRESDAQIVTIRSVVLTFLTIHLAIIAIFLFQATLSRSSLDFLRDLHLPQQFKDVVRVLDSASYINPFLLIGMAILVKPLFWAFRRDAMHHGAKKRGKFLRPVAWFLFWIAIPVVPVLAVWSQLHIDYEKRLLESTISLTAVLAGGLLLLWFVLFWLLKGVLRIPVRPKDAVRASWAMLLLPVVPPLADAANGFLRQLVAGFLNIYPMVLPEHASRYISFVIVSVLGAVFLWRVGELSIRLSQSTYLWAWFRSENKILIALPLLIISFPVADNAGPGPSVFTFSGFFYAVDSLLPYALLIGTVVLTRRLNIEDSFQLGPAELHLGALVFAWYVSGQGASLLFIPVPFLIAWYLFRHWLLAPPPDSAPTSSAVLNALLDERRARARTDEIEKGLNKKLGEGDIELLEYSTRLSKAKEEALSAAAVLSIATKGAEPRVLSMGPESGPFANAKIAVRYGLVISLPFQVIVLTRFVRQSFSEFPFLELAYALAFSVTTWALMAAVFGYFFHWIRGRNGFEKALWYSGAVILPTLPMHLIAGESVTDRAQLLDMVQVVAFILVLALVAFDHRTMTKQRRTGRDLLTLYGLASAAYGSSIAIAIASTLASKELLVKILGWALGRSEH